MCPLTLSKSDINFLPNECCQGEWHKNELLVFNAGEHYANIVLMIIMVSSCHSIRGMRLLVEHLKYDMTGEEGFIPN